jgi:hypothetical protein
VGVTDGQMRNDVALDPGSTPGPDGPTRQEAVPASNGVVRELSAIGERA